MASLGSFRAAVREQDPDVERDTFEFYGDTFTVVGDVPAILELQMSAAIAGKASGVEGDAAVFASLRAALVATPKDGDEADTGQWDRFYRLAADNRVGPETLTELVLTIIAAQAGRPTVQRSASDGGSLPTSTSSSPSVSDSPASPGLKSVDDLLAG